MIFRNIESGEIKEGKTFKNETIQIINPTNEILSQYGWEIIEDYPIDDEVIDEENNEEINENDDE